jgi:cytidine deaminase
LGSDASALLKREMLEEIFTELYKEGWLSPKADCSDVEHLVNEVLGERRSVRLSGARISNIIEFGRIVHAEMSALMEAARKGAAVKGSHLYCTTFPCHMCARHIIAAGIQTVYYIEPYPKSMAKRLYTEEICVDGDPPPKNPDAVIFRPYVGIAPKRYAEWFAMRKRKTPTGLAVPADGSLHARRIARIVDLPPVEEALYGVTPEMTQKILGERNDQT